MSDFTPTDLNDRDILARIDRNQAETRKLLAEADKLRRDRFLAPLLAAGAMAGVISALIPIILRSWGVR